MYPTGSSRKQKSPRPGGPSPRPEPETDLSAARDAAEDAEMRRGRRKGLFILSGGLLLVAVLLLILTRLMPEKGYYTKDGSVWYFEHGTWFVYDAGSADWRVSDSPGPFRRMTYTEHVPDGVPEAVYCKAYETCSETWLRREQRKSDLTGDEMTDRIIGMIEDPEKDGKPPEDTR